MSISNKIIIGLIFFIVFILGLGAWDIRQNNIKTIVSGQAHAGILDDISTAITGHAKDLKDRILKDQEFITGEVIKSGEFTYSKDSIHWANGTLDIVKKDGKTYIQLNESFETGLAPDLYIFTSTSVIKTQGDVNVAKKENLQKLKLGKGASFYEVKGDIKSIVIWCKAFNQLMGSAVV